MEGQETDKAKLEKMKAGVENVYDFIKKKQQEYIAKVEQMDSALAPALANIYTHLKEIKKDLHEFVESEKPIAALNKAQRGKEYEVITAAGARVAEKIESGDIKVPTDLKDILLALNLSGGIATVVSQGAGSNQRPFVELFMLRDNAMSALAKLAQHPHILLLGAHPGEENDEFPLQWSSDGTVTRHLSLCMSDQYEDRHVELCKMTDMKISYDMKGLRLVAVVWLGPTCCPFQFPEVLQALLP
jgi:hypothetical protein